MVNLIDHITKNIQEIGNNNINEYPQNIEEALSSSITEISSLMDQMGLNENIIDDLKSNLTQTFKSNIQEGMSPEEAFKETFDTIDTVLSQSMSSDPKIGKEIDSSNSYNLDFANSSKFDNSILIDQAMAKGLSFNEAVKYVNDSINSNEKIEYGPPTLADIKPDENNVDIVSSDDEKNLDKLEVDMDDQASKVSNDETLNDNSNFNDSNLQILNDDSEDELS